MVVNIRKVNDTVVISATGRMDAVSAPDFDKALEDLIGKTETRFVIDFGGLEYISSAGLQCLLAAAKKLELKNGHISLADLKGPVKDVFEMSGFDTIFPIFTSIDAALSHK